MRSKLKADQKYIEVALRSSRKANDARALSYEPKRITVFSANTFRDGEHDGPEHRHTIPNHVWRLRRYARRLSNMRRFLGRPLFRS
jgi:hypothetical protein